MAEVLNSSKITTSAGKLGQWKFVAGLAAVFVVLFALGGEDEETADLSDTTSAPTASAGSEVSATSGNSSARREILWPEVPLEFLLTHNPFHPDFPEPQGAVTAAESDGVAAVRFNTPPGDVVPPDMATAPNENIAQIDANPSMSPHPVMTRKNPAVTMTPPDMKVQMILRSAGGKAAMIDNRIYHEGDHINGFEVASIAQDGVTLRLVQVTETQPEAAE